MKVCATHLAEIDNWAIDRLGESIVRCGICHPTGAAVQPLSTKHNEKKMAAAVPEGRVGIHGPTPDSLVVQAWADDYI